MVPFSMTKRNKVGRTKKRNKAHPFSLNTQKQQNNSLFLRWIYAPLDLVRNNVRVTGYPLSHVHFVKGKVEDTLPRTKPPEPIVLLRLDTDFYHSTKAELEHLYPLLVSGGMLIIDDYCIYPGCRLAADEYFASIGTSVEMLLNGRGPCPTVPVLTKP